jgi:hypothetical protein
MENTVLGSILGVFDAIGTWFAEFVPTLTDMFYVPARLAGDGSVVEGTGQLTFLGVLAVAGLAISVVFLVIGLIQNFLHFRG